MLQMGGFSSHAVPPSQDIGANLHVPPILPPARFALHAKEPIAVAVTYHDTAPPPRTRRLNLYYSVFLK